jgi:putative ABC transport system permease protein
MQNPMRALLSVLSVALGSAAVILVLNLTFQVNGFINQAVSNIESFIVIANARVEDDGAMNWQGQGAFSSGTVEALRREFPDLKHLTAMNNGMGTNFEIRSDGEYYRIRNVTPVRPDYKELYGLEMRAGTFISDNDLQEREPVAVISEPVAKVLFGSADAAVGRQITQVQMNPAAGSGERLFTIIGVFAEPSYFEKMVLRIADLAVPMTLFRRYGSDNYRVIAGRLEGMSFESAKPRIKSIMDELTEEHTAVSIWQGSLFGPQGTGMLDAMKSSVRTLSLFFSALGLAALLVSAFGIFSIMLVSILERTREVGLRRALGSTKAGIIAHFISESFLFTALGTFFGTAIAFLFSHPMMDAVISMISFGPAGTQAAVPLFLSFKSVLAGALLSIGMGTVFGIIPAVNAARVAPLESLREQ